MKELQGGYHQLQEGSFNIDILRQGYFVGERGQPLLILLATHTGHPDTPSEAQNFRLGWFLRNHLVQPLYFTDEETDAQRGHAAGENKQKYNPDLRSRVLRTLPLGRYLSFSFFLF